MGILLGMNIMQNTIKRKIRLIEYAIAESFVNISRNGMQGFAVVTTTAFTLFVLWTFIMMSMGANNVTSQEIGRFEVAVYLNENITLAQATKTAEEIKKIPGVGGVVLKQKDKEWELFKIKNPYIEAAGLPSDCLPFAISVKPKDPESAMLIADRIRKINTVSTVLEGREEYRKIIAIAKTIRWLSIIGALVLFMITSTVISNAIKLTLYARRKEIETMQLVGATAPFIRFPFVFEGMIFGLFGSLLAFALVELTNLLITNKIKMAISMVSSWVNPIPTGYIFWSIIICGVTIGAVGSMISLKKYLKV